MKYLCTLYSLYLNLITKLFLQVYIISNFTTKLYDFYEEVN